MRKFIPYLFLGLVAFLWPSWSNGQAYSITNSSLDVGNPGGLRTVGDFTTTGGTSVLNGGSGSTTVNYWSNAVSIPFTFNFYGSPVSHFIVSKNGLMTFDTTNSGLPVGTALNVNTALPNANLPNNTIAFFWEDTSSTSISTSDHVYTYTYGTAPNRQFWVHYYSFEVGSQSYCYWAAVLEETTDKIYVVDMNYAGSPSSYTGTVGIQINSTTAYEVTTPLNGTMGSPNIAMGTDGSSVSNNEYYEFMYLAPGACIPPTALTASALTSTTASASWTTGGAANSLVEYGATGFTLGTGMQSYVATTTANLMGLTPNTTYDVYVKDSCATNSSTWVGPVTFTTPCAAAMSGNYTINGSLPTAGTNFNSFAEAAAELSACGVSGPVTIDVVQGTYNEQFSISAIAGASSVNTVVIQPAAANTMPAEVTFAATSSSDNYVMRLTGTSYLTVKGLTLTATGASTARVIELYENCSNVNIEDNILNGVASTTTSNAMAVIYNGTATVDTISYMTIRGNTLTNGSYGVYIYGTSSAYAMNNTIDSNSITDYYYMGVYSYYQQGLKINGNTIIQNSLSPYSTGYGVYNYYGDYSTVMGNTITVYGTSTNYGIYDYYCDADAVTPNLIANNMVSCNNNSGSTYGIYAFNNYYTDIVFNSVNVTAGSATAGRGIYLNSSTSGTYGFINLQNNNVANVGGGYAVEVSSGAVTLGYVTSSDYNNLYGTGTTLARINNTNYADIAAYTLAVPTFDQNSVSDAPLFAAPDDLHASSPTLNNAGSPYAGITVDIDGEMRSVTTPDIGADEFTPPSCLPSSGLVLVTAYADSAVVSWRPGSGLTYTLEYDSAGFTQGLGISITGIADTFYTITGLAPNALYEFYILNDCGMSGISPWAGPGSFKTLIPGPRNISCGPGTVLDTIFTEEFDNATSFTGDIGTSNGTWQYDNNTTGSGSTGPSGPHSGTHYLFAETSTGGPDTMRVVSPAIDLTTAMTAAELSFWMHAYGASIGILNVGVSTSVTGPFSTQFTYGPGELQTDELDPYQNIGVNLDAWLGQTVYIQFEYVRGSTFTGDLAIDLVEVYSCVDPCAIANTTYPWIEDFEMSGSSLPNCWFNDTADDSDWIFRNGAIGHGATTDHTLGTALGYYAGVDDSQSSPTDTLNNLLTPIMDLTSLTVPRLNFWYFIGNDNVLTSTLYIDVYDGSTWNLGVDTIEFTQAAWLQAFVDLSLYKAVNSRIRFRAVESTDFNSDISIDDIVIEESPSCIAPTALGATNILTTSADLYWTTGGAANANVEYGAAGFTQGTGTMVSTTNDTISVMGLMAGTSYEFYVRDSCAVGDVSAWVGPFAFSTPVCSPSSSCTHTLVLSDLFGDGWNGTEVTVYQNGAAVAVIGPSFTSATGNPAGDTLSITLPLCDNFNTYFVITNGSNGTPFWSEEIGLEVIDTYNSQVAFYDDNASADQGDTIITFLSSCAAPNCIPPSALGSFNLTQNSADIYWTKGSASATSIVEYGPLGFTPGMGTQVQAANDTITLVGLMPSTVYTFCVTDSCGVGNVSTTVCANFTTSCAVYTAPFLETFDGTNRPVCWSETAVSGGPWEFGGAGTNAVNCAAATDHTGNSGNYAWMDQSGADAAVSLATPVVDVSSLTQPYLDFFYWMCGAGYTPNNKTFLEYWSGTNWVVFDSIIDSTQGWEYYAFDLTGKTYSTGLVQVRFRAESGGSVSDFYGDNAIDDVYIGEKRQCLDPTGLIITATSLNSATLAWNSDTSISASLIEYGPTGFVLGTGTQVPAAAGSGVVNNLAPGTCYDFYIADSCGNSLLAWLGPVNGCTASPCTVTTTPTNVTGDTTACGGGLVNLSATSTGNVAWISGGEVVGTGSSFTPDSIFFTTNFEAHDYVTSGPSVHVGPMPSIATTGFGNFSNGQWISVQDTVYIDSTTVRANGYVNAQVWILDPAQTRVIQRGEIFETDSNVTANYQVPVGILLTPGVYYMAIDFDITAISVGQLFRATGGAVFPYVAAGLMSIDSVNFAGPRYYYTFDVVVTGACLGNAATPMAVGFVPGANAGTSDSVAVCITNSMVDLSTYLGVHDAGGVWSDDNSTGALTGGIFDASAVMAGTYSFTYRLAAAGGCAADSATIEVTVVNGGSAGPDTTVVGCVTGASIQLRNYVATLGGSFANLDNASGVIGGSLIIPATAGAGTYRFSYRLPAGVCAADTAMITVVIDPAANAGADASDTVCDTLTAIDLTTYLDANATMGGVWKDVNNSGGLTGAMFNPSAVVSGNTYVLRYVVENGCGKDSADITLLVDCNISLTEFGVTALEVFPNPTSGVINIHTTNPIGGDVELELYSVSGKLLMSKSASFGADLSIDISRFADGVYNLKIITEDGAEVHRVTKM